MLNILITKTNSNVKTTTAKKKLNTDKWQLFN